MFVKILEVINSLGYVSIGYKHGARKILRSLTNIGIGHFSSHLHVFQFEISIFVKFAALMHLFVTSKFQVAKRTAVRGENHHLTPTHVTKPAAFVNYQQM